LRPEADEVTPDLVHGPSAFCRKTFRYIVVDLGVTITDTTLALLDLTQHVVLVAAPELFSLEERSRRDRYLAAAWVRRTIGCRSC